MKAIFRRSLNCNHAIVAYLVCVTSILSTICFGQPQPIPTFTPNVVDSVHTLTKGEIQSINQTLKVVRSKADILGAVFIVDSLQEESIEDLAERAFKKWELGTGEKDNGLLLVLAMNDRKSRFEVGYGLEGDLPDLIAKRALDDYLRPLMRKGQIKEAVIHAFYFMAMTRAKNPEFKKQFDRQLQKKFPWYSKLNELDAGIWAFCAYLVCLWSFWPITVWTAFQRARRLESMDSEYKIHNDVFFNKGAISLWSILFSPSPVFYFAGLLFLSANPGMFIYLLADVSPFILIPIFILLGLVFKMLFKRMTGPYESPAAYRAFIEKARRENQALVEKGYAVETAPGHFEKTPAYYSSPEYRSSSRSSSSSSGSSGSSGGGRSGGGGASSSW